jgi:hypothetical protein
MMRFRLRTLLIVLTIGPPVLAGVWLAAQRLSLEMLHCAYLLIVLTVLCATAAILPPLFMWGFSLFANALVSELFQHEN